MNRFLFVAMTNNAKKKQPNQLYSTQASDLITSSLVRVSHRFPRSIYFSTEAVRERERAGEIEKFQLGRSNKNAPIFSSSNQSINVRY